MVLTYKQHLKQNEIKLDILHSLARSQRALSRIIESMADVAGTSEKASLELLYHAADIGQYQKMLAVRMAGIHLHKNRRYGKPAKPWLQTQRNFAKKERIRNRSVCTDIVQNQKN